MQGWFQDLKKECGSGPLTNICLTNLFRRLFKEFGTKSGGRAPCPPPPLDPRLQWSLNEDNNISLTLVQISWTVGV